MVECHIGSSQFLLFTDLPDVMGTIEGAAIRIFIEIVPSHWTNQEVLFVASERTLNKPSLSCALHKCSAVFSLQLTKAPLEICYPFSSSFISLCCYLVVRYIRTSQFLLSLWGSIVSLLGAQPRFSGSSLLFALPSYLLPFVQLGLTTMFWLCHCLFMWTILLLFIACAIRFFPFVSVILVSVDKLSFAFSYTILLIVLSLLSCYFFLPFLWDSDLIGSLVFNTVCNFL